MANSKISALSTATTPLTGAELVPIVQSSVNKKTTTSDILGVPATLLTASSAVATDASKKFVSVTNTGTGNNVLATSPTLVTPALGTPSSGVVTNLTGTASININGTVGATTPTTGNFTTLKATGVATFLGGSSLGLTIRSNGIRTEEFNGTDLITVNFRGYLNGTTQFRNFYVYDGKENVITATSSTGLAVTGVLSSTGALTTAGGATFHTTSTALTNGAGAAAGTITNAPIAGNPTKWIGINDNGTIRYIPAW